MYEQSQRQQQAAQKQSPEGSDSNVRKLTPPPFQLKANPVPMKESEEEEVVSASAETVQMFADASESGTNQPNNVVQKKDAAASGAPGITADGVPAEFIEHLKLREGWRTEVYLDTRNLPTVGLGHLLTAEENKQYKVGDTVPNDILNGWAVKDAKKAYDAATGQVATLGVASQSFTNALASVNFQLGTGWNTKFKKTWSYMVAKEWEKAALEAQDSAWYAQTPVRVQDFQAALRALAGSTPTTEAPATSPESSTHEFQIGAPTGTGTSTGDGVNVRKGPGTQYDKTGKKLAKGNTVNIYGESGGWVCIGQGEWVSKDFISSSNSAGEAPKANAGPNVAEIVKNVWEAMFGGYTGMGTDEDAVYSNLGKLNRDAKLIDEFKALYRKTYGTDVVSDIRSEFSNSMVFGNQLDQALGYLNAKAGPNNSSTNSGPIVDGGSTNKDSKSPSVSDPKSAPAASPPASTINFSSLKGNVGASTKNNSSPNFAVDVKTVQTFLVAFKYLDSNSSEISAVNSQAKINPDQKIAEADLSATINAIKSFQKNGATDKSRLESQNGQILKNGRESTHMKVASNVHDKYGGTQPLEETVNLLSESQWHSQARFGYNFKDGQDATEIAYMSKVKEIAGIDDPADIYKATTEQIQKIRAADSRWSDSKWSDNEDLKIHGIRKGDKLRESKPNWICCFDTALKMLKYTGADPKGENEKIQTFVEKGHQGGQFTQQAALGFQYIDGQLKGGKAVFVGVDKISGDNKNHNEGVTDHYIVIMGKGKDSTGWFFRYFDPGSTSKANGTSKNNKLYIGAQYQSASNDKYNLSQIRVNNEEGI